MQAYSINHKQAFLWRTKSKEWAKCIKIIRMRNYRGMFCCLNDNVNEKNKLILRCFLVCLITRKMSVLSLCLFSGINMGYEYKMLPKT